MTAWSIISDQLSRRALRHERPTADDILDALREAGWHLVSTPTFTERDEREAWDTYRTKPGKTFELAAIVDDKVVEVSERVTALVLDQSRMDLVPHLKRSLSLKFVRLLGGRLGVEGCE